MRGDYEEREEEGVGEGGGGIGVIRLRMVVAKITCGDCWHEPTWLTRSIEERSLHCARRLVRRNERGRKSRAAPVGMTRF